MASDMSKETADFFKSFIEVNQPYSLAILDDLMFDDKRYDENRLLATEALKHLLEAGYSEEEVNPWLVER